MALTLNDGTNPIVTLPDELVWQDEFDWSSITHSKDFTVSGALSIQVGEKLAGRDITLVGTESLGWIDRDTVEALITMRDDDLEITLTLQDARTCTARFKQGETCIDVEPIIPHKQFESNMWYKIKAIRLFAITDIS